LQPIRTYVTLEFPKRYSLIIYNNYAYIVDGFFLLMVAKLMTDKHDMLISGATGQTP